MRGLFARLVRMLARWLYGLAARLERFARPVLAPATLSALADRFPGAPDYWLRDIAEHVDAFETLTADEATPPEPEQQALDRPAIMPRAPALPQHRPRPELRIAQPREVGRVEARSKSAAHASRPALRWLSAATSTRQAAEAGTTTHHNAAPVPASHPPALTPRRWRKWIGRIAGRRPGQPIASMPDRVREPSADAPAPQPQAERIFAMAKRCPRRRNPFIGNIAEPADRSALGWPEPLASPTTRQLCFETSSADRPVQAWVAAVEGSWPALPDTGQTIADAAPATRPLHDFNREQMAGLWSG